MVLGHALLPQKEISCRMAGLLLLRGEKPGWGVSTQIQQKDLKKDDYAALSEALKDWDREIKKIRDETEKLIMMK